MDSITETDYIPAKDIDSWLQEYMLQCEPNVILLKGRGTGKTYTARIYESMLVRERVKHTVSMINNLIKQLNRHELQR